MDQERRPLELNTAAKESRTRMITQRIKDAAGFSGSSVHFAKEERDSS